MYLQGTCHRTTSAGKLARMSVETLSHWIDGRAAPPAQGRYLDVFEPATGMVYARCPDGSAADVEAAVAAARSAAPAWAALPARERAACLTGIAARIRERLEDFARAESRDTGKPVALARSVDIPRAIANLEFFAAAIQTWHSEAHDMDGRAINITLRPEVPHFAPRILVKFLGEVNEVKELR